MDKVKQGAVIIQDCAAFLRSNHLVRTLRFACLVSRVRMTSQCTQLPVSGWRAPDCCTVRTHYGAIVSDRLSILSCFVYSWAGGILGSQLSFLPLDPAVDGGARGKSLTSERSKSRLQTRKNLEELLVLRTYQVCLTVVSNDKKSGLGAIINRTALRRYCVGRVPAGLGGALR